MIRKFYFKLYLQKMLCEKHVCSVQRLSKLENSKEREKKLTLIQSAHWQKIVNNALPVFNHELRLY